MKKIIVISYYFPPCAKAGAHRAYSMAEYLPRFGWQPIFIAPEKGYYGRLPRIDNALLERIERHPIYRIPFFYPFNNEDSTLLARGVRYLWETILIPDGKILWNREIKRKLRQIVIKHKPDVFFITATPFSSFLLAPYLKKMFRLPVVLDYRDPWAIDLNVGHRLLKARLNFYLEKRILLSADLVTTASYYMIDYIRKILTSVAHNKQYFAFPYGYDGEFLRKEILPILPEKSEEKIKVVFAGTQVADLDPNIVLSGIKMAINNDKNAAEKLQIDCYGTIFGYTGEPTAIIKKYSLTKYVYYNNFLPYLQFLKVLRKSSFLVQPLGVKTFNLVIFPTKFFDYLGVQRPILYIGGKGQVTEVIYKCNAGVCALSDPYSISQALIKLINSWDKKSWYSNSSEYSKLDRINIFNDFCEKLNKL